MDTHGARGCQKPLKGVSINKSLSTVHVTVTGAPENVINLAIGGQTYQTDALVNKKYTTQDFIGLLNDLELKLNQALLIDATITSKQGARGIGFKVDVVDNKIEISTRQSTQDFFVFARPTQNPATFMESNTYNPNNNIDFSTNQSSRGIVWCHAEPRVAQSQRTPPPTGPKCS